MLARETRELTFEELPSAVVHEAKRRVLDIIACGIGGYDSRPSQVVQDLVRELGGPAEATVIGSGFRTSCMNASLANGVMVRYTEAMDISLERPDGQTWLAHPGEVIPGIVAVGERQHSSGKEIIACVVLGYQLLNRLAAAMGGAKAISLMGWRPEIRAGFIVPLVVGRLLGLSEEQTVNAVGISGCYTGELGILDHWAEVRTMGRNLRFPYANYQAILAALLAQKGFEGPSRVFEGHHGFAEVMCGGKIDLSRVTRRDEGFGILNTCSKWYPVDGRLPGEVEALTRLVTEHDLTPENVAHVTIRTSPHVVNRMGDALTHRYPATKETADHSAYYVAALAIVDREVRLDLGQFSAGRLQDPRLLEVIDKIELVAVPEWTADTAPTEVEIAATDGETYRCRVDYPKGHVLNPLTDAELEEKLREMASRFIDEGQIREISQVVFNLERLGDIAELTRVLVFAR